MSSPMQKVNELTSAALAEYLNNRKEGRLVEFLADDPTDFTTAPEQIWVNTTDDLLKYTSDSGIKTIKLGELYSNVESFGAKGDGVADDTVAIQAAIDAATNGIVYFPNNGNVYRTNKLFISENMIILGNGCTIQGIGNAIFCVDADLEYLIIDRFNATFPGVTGNQGREFFVNVSVGGVIGNNTTNFETGTEFNIERLEIKNCDLNICKVSIYGATTIPYVTNNTWDNTSTVTTAPAYLQINKGDYTVKNTNGWILNNKFVVFPPTSSNQDIVKVSGGTQSIVIQGNYIKNTNPACYAQVDVFTGGDRMRFIDNTLINTQLHRKQVKGALASAPIIHYDLIEGNHVAIEAGQTLSTAFYLVGSLFSVVANQIVSSNTTALQIAFHMDNSDVIYDSFNTDSNVAFIVSNNIVDFRTAHASSQFINYETGGIGTALGLGIISQNIYLGGQRFIIGVPKNTTVMGNVWGNSSGASGTSFINTTAPGIAIGNVADSSVPVINALMQGNSATYSFPSVNTATDTTPSVNGSSRFNFSGGGTVTNFDDGINGQEITIFASGGGCTIQHNANVMLNGSANFVMAARASLTLVKFSDGTWQEIGRKTP